MIEKKRRLWFSSIVLTLEDAIADSIAADKTYDSITILSYLKKEYPGFRCKSKTTALIDLTLTEEDVFARMKDTTRNEIRRTFKDSTLSFSGPLVLSDEIYALYSKFEKAQGRRPVSRAEMKAYKYFVGFSGKRLLSGAAVLSGTDRLRIRSIFSLRLATENPGLRKQISNASRRVLWEICLWGKKNAYLSLDLASVNLTDSEKKGITDFKMSFGGILVEEYTYMYRSVLFSLFERAATLRARLRI